MRYILQDLCDIAIAQVERKWNKIKEIIRYNYYYMGISIVTVVIPLAALVVLELVCLVALKRQNTQIMELVQMLK